MQITKRYIWDKKNTNDFFVLCVITMAVTWIITFYIILIPLSQRIPRRYISFCLIILYETQKHINKYVQMDTHTHTNTHLRTPPAFLCFFIDLFSFPFLSESSTSILEIIYISTLSQCLYNKMFFIVFLCFIPVSLPL